MMMIKLISYAAIVSLFSYPVSSFSYQQATRDQNHLDSDGPLDVSKLLNTPLQEERNKTLQYCPVDESVKKSIRELLKDIVRILRAKSRQKSWKRHEETNHRVQRRQTVSESSRQGNLIN